MTRRLPLPPMPILSESSGYCRGWEVAPSISRKIPIPAGTLNLGKLAACFSEGDEYRGYDADWCRGCLPTRFPGSQSSFNYCAKEGFGPER